MKIRTRLLLFLLPTLIGSIAFISTLLAYNWRKEIVNSFKMRLKTAVASTAAMIHPEDFKEKDLFQSQALHREISLIQKELGIERLYLVPLDSPEIGAIPKDLHITPIYKPLGSQKKVMTGYAPIFDQKGHIAALAAADIHVDLIDKTFHESLLWIILSSSATLIIMIAMLFLIANKISKPVQKLNNSALAIAAGQYGGSIQVKGPKEIAELANTLNTMSECLLENIGRLKENSLLRERMYGEYECSMLLQHLMLQKNIENCRSDAIAVKSITLFSENPRGFLLDFPKTESPDLFQIHLAEAEEEGFEGMYQLLTQYKHAKKSQIPSSLLLQMKNSTLTCKGVHFPLFWSLSKARLEEIDRKKPKAVESGDYFFLFNRGLLKLYKDPKAIGDLLSKVLRVFAHEGLETLTAMLQKEVLFASKKKSLEEDLHLLAFQILNV